MNRYEVIATLGPASSQPETWHAMLAAGVTAFRLNTSHLSLPQLAGWLEQLETYWAGSGQRVPVVLDLQGSKWRLGEIKPVDVMEGQLVELVLVTAADQPGRLPVPHADFFAAARHSDGEIVLNDARVRLSIEAIHTDSILARVIQAGPLAAHKGITFHSCDYRIETLSEKDRSIFQQTHALQGIQYAVSYIKDGLEMAQYRREFGPDSRLIAKLERGPAMADAAAIAASADELWVCRGDLGAEVGLAGMAAAVHAFTPLVVKLAVSSIMAGQVLEHLTEHATPTRSEVCYLYDCLQQGYRGFVLSDETAIGQDPLGAARTACLFK